MRSTVLFDTTRFEYSKTAGNAVIVAEFSRSNARRWSRTNSIMARRRVSSSQKESS